MAAVEGRPVRVRWAGPALFFSDLSWWIASYWYSGSAMCEPEAPAWFQRGEAVDQNDQSERLAGTKPGLDSQAVKMLWENTER
jgi:hypothetical protein